MNSKITKWGNSLGVHIPRALAALVGITENTPVELSTEHEAIIIKPLKRKESLRDLAAKITPDNKHDEADWGGPVGKEAW